MPSEKHRIKTLSEAASELRDIEAAVLYFLLDEADKQLFRELRRAYGK